MSVQNKFNVGDKVKWNDVGYWRAFFEDMIDFEDVLTVVGYEDHPSLVELQNDSGVVVIAFDWRFDLVESFQELNASHTQGMPSIQGKVCTQNCVSCKGEQTPTLEDKDENEWFKRGELPPVGTVCECQNNSMQWLKGTIVHVGEDNGTTLAIMQTSTEILYGEVGEFRPIQSPEQIAAEERAVYCDQIYAILCKAERKNNRSDMAEALYDAGLRFVDEEVE